MRPWEIVPLEKFLALMCKNDSSQQFLFSFFTSSHVNLLTILEPTYITSSNNSVEKKVVINFAETMQILLMQLKTRNSSWAFRRIFCIFSFGCSFENQTLPYLLVTSSISTSTT